MDKINSVAADYEKVCKKQKISGDKSLKDVDSIIRALEGFSKALECSDGPPSQEDVCNLKMELKEKASKLSADHKEAHSSIARLGKTIDKQFQTDISRTTNPEAFKGKSVVLNEAIAQHLFRQGKFRVGETFLKECGMGLEEAQREPFMDMYNILEAIKREDLGPALQWACARKGVLEKKGSLLEFKLRKLQFIQLLQKGNTGDALRYARSNFAPFSVTHMKEIQRLMGSFLYVGRLDQSPYSDFFDPILWSEISHSFTRDCCTLLGLSYDSPLYVSVTIGCSALPTLLKMAAVMQSNNGGNSKVWNQTNELPVEIHLPNEYQYHSVFACPVSREQSTDENPPMQLPCGHVICKFSLLKLSKGNRFKCPYCPSEQTPAQAKQVYF
eukprot:Nk52_evm89s1737 gene=Nk52_evmTU89s1737